MRRLLIYFSIFKRDLGEFLLFCAAEFLIAINVQLSS